MCVEFLCEIFRQIGQKMNKLYTIEYLGVIACSQIEPGGRQEREGRGWGNVPMY